MTKVRNGSIASYASVAAVAGLLSAVGTWSATQFVATSAAQPAAAPGQLLTQPLSDLPGREVRISTLDREPGASTARHRHPGHHTFGYVIEGTVEFAINGRRRASSRLAIPSMNRQRQFTRSHAIQVRINGQKFWCHGG